MPLTQQTFLNEKTWPIYVSVEPWPQCFELMPNDCLTLTWDGPDVGDASQFEWINDEEIIVWPEGNIDAIEYLINGEPAKDRSWDFKFPIVSSQKTTGFWSAIRHIFR